MSVLGSLSSPITNAAGDLTGGLVGGAVGSVVNQVAGWLNDLVGGLLQHIFDTSGSSAQVTGTGFTQLYAAMIVPAMVLSVIVLVLGTGMAAIQGRAAEIIKRALVMPLAVVVVVGLAAAFTNDSLRLVDWLDTTYSGMALGPGGLSSALAKIGQGTSGSSLAIAGVSTPGASELLQVIVMFFMLLATLAVFIELQVRTLVIWLMVAIVPLGAAGLFWSGTEKWMKRLSETLVAAILTPFPITVILSVGVKLGMDTNSLSKVIISLVALGLAAFSLPMMMKLVPIAELAAVSGMGSQLTARLRGHAVTTGKAAATGALAEGGPNAQRLAGQIQSGGVGTTALAGAGAAAGGAGVWAVSKSIGFAKDRLNGSVGKAAGPASAGADGTGPGSGSDAGNRDAGGGDRRGGGERVRAGGPTVGAPAAAGKGTRPAGSPPGTNPADVAGTTGLVSTATPPGPAPRPPSHSPEPAVRATQPPLPLNTQPSAPPVAPKPPTRPIAD
ncbi:MAG TPA: hypothetical protein VHU85_08275 [Acidimicrobiales bacterium]|jgi:hypothetical protein|nr:hypothetical protein [Acidimicrobiales bacterium]